VQNDVISNKHAKQAHEAAKVINASGSSLSLIKNKHSPFYKIGMAITK